MSLNVRSSSLDQNRIRRAAVRLMLAVVALGFGGSFNTAQAAVAQLVQSGTAVNTANGIQTIGISSVDTTKSVLIFQARSNSNRPVASEVRGRLQSATTIQFERVTDEASPAAINIQWYVVTFGSGVKVQRGETTQSAATTNVAITAVGALTRAFVLWSKTAVNSDQTWSADDTVLGELTTTTNLQFRTNTLNAGHIIAWQVVEFTNAADINVQKGTTSLIGPTVTTSVTLPTAVNVNKTFVLIGARTTDGTGPDIGTRLVRARLTNSTTLIIDRSIMTTADVTEVVYQVVELKDNSYVWSGNATFAAGVSQATGLMGNPLVNLNRAVAFLSTQNGGGQNGGRSPYASDDIVGVASFTASITAQDTVTLTRDNTAAAADAAWFVVQFDGGSPFKVGSFTASTASAPSAQTIAHGLGQVPKALLLWTEGRTNNTFSSASAIAYRSAASNGAVAAVTSVAVNKPAGTIQGDVMIASVAQRSNPGGSSTNNQAATVFTAPAGWTLIRRTDNTTANTNSMAVYYKVAGPAEPASYTWSFSVSYGAAIGIASFSGVDTTNPVDIDAGAATTSSLNHTAPTVTTTTNKGLVMAMFSYSSSASWTPPATMTEIVDRASDAIGTNGVTLEMTYKTPTNAAATGTFTATAAQDADRGCTETLALRPAMPAYFGWGVTDGTTSRSISADSRNAGTTTAAATRIADKALTIVKWDVSGTPVVLAEADVTSWDDTNIVLNWTTADNFAYVIHYVAVGGTDLSAKVLNWTTGTTTGNVAVTGVGFEPTVVFSAHAGYQQTAASGNAARSSFGWGVMDFNGDQWANTFYSRSGLGTSDTQRAQVTDSTLMMIDQTPAVQKRASFVSMDSDGFTVNFTNSTSANNAQVISLALAGLNAKVGAFNKSTAAATASQAITGVNFKPALAMFTSVQDVTQASAQAHTRFGIGASDGVTEGASAFQAQNGAGIANVAGIDKTDKVFMKVNNSTPALDAEADLASFDVDGFTLSWTTNDAVATEILYIAMGPLDVTEVKLTSFTAAKYDRGVLLQWRTGYEIDNLGFNLYREVDGVRSKVNAGLIAGSGLTSGRGTAVTAELSYARWDLDAPATAVYWLEDIDFNGKTTLHGPVTPVAGTLQSPETVTVSADLKDLGRRTKHRRVMVKHNDDFSRDFRRGRNPSAPKPQGAAETQVALAAQASIKIGVKTAGWYRITRADLVAAGLNPSVDPRMLHLFSDGTEQSMRVGGEADGRFDAIEFYGVGLDSPYADTNVYWLAAGNARGLRFDTVGAPAGAAVQNSRASFWSTLQRKDRSIYFAALKNGDAENWFGPMVSADPLDVVMTVDHVDHDAAAPAQLTVTLQGVTNAADGSNGHYVSVLVNGVEVGEVDFEGQENSQQTLSLPVSALVDGDNTITLVALGGDVDLSLLDVLSLGYWHTYRADNDMLRFSVDQPGPITIGGFASPAIRVVDVTDGANSFELRGAVKSEGNGYSSITVRSTGYGSRTLLAFTDATMATPAFVIANQPSNWHAATHAHDYLAISHGDFVEQVRPLVAAREQQGHHAALVDVEDIYDEFSFGEKTPQALRDFLQWAKAHWRETPKFVVLVGDATVDPRDYAEMGAADFVPTKQVPMSSVTLESASDDWFVDFNNDGLPDVAIGRLSVRTPEQAEAVVSKIVEYDRTPVQAWTKSVLLVADDDENGAFAEQSEVLASSLPASYTASRVYRGWLGDVLAHDTLAARVNEGQLVVNYTGHGSVGIWGSNGQLLTGADVAANFTNRPRLPFVVAMNCLNGMFNQVWDEESLAESLLRSPNGGASAVWASSSVTSSATQALVDRELFRLIFSGTYATLGEAVAAAKRAVSVPDLRRSWIFFGDPAQHLLGAPMPATMTKSPSVVTPARTASTSSTGTTSQSGQSSNATNAAADRMADTIRLADSNGDRRADLWLYGGETGSYAAALNGANGRMTFRAGVWDRGWQVVAADLNGDGTADFAFYKSETAEWVQALASGDGSFAFTRGTFAAAGRMQLVVADFNNDRRDDVLLYNAANGAWTIAYSDGRGGFTTRTGSWLAGLRVRAGDFNADGYADVFGYDSVTGAGVLALNRRDGQFTASTGDWGRGWRVSVARLDGNTTSDLLFYNPSTGAWQAAFADGSGRFSTKSGSWPAALELHVADLDGDGRDDVFGYDPTTGQVMTALNTANGRFSVTTAAWTTGWTVAVGDLNGDGRDDVALYDAATGIWIQCVSAGNGSFTFTSGTALTDAAPVGVPQ